MKRIITTVKNKDDIFENEEQLNKYYEESKIKKYEIKHDIYLWILFGNLVISIILPKEDIVVFEPIMLLHLELVRDVFAIELISYTFNHFAPWSFRTFGLIGFIF